MPILPPPADDRSIAALLVAAAARMSPSAVIAVFKDLLQRVKEG